MKTTHFYLLASILLATISNTSWAQTITGNNNSTLATTVTISPDNTEADATGKEENPLDDLVDKANRMEHAEWMEYALQEQKQLLQSTSSEDWMRALNAETKDAKAQNVKWSFSDSIALRCLPTAYDMAVYEVLYANRRYLPSGMNADTLRKEWMDFHKEKNPLFTTHGKEWKQGVRYAFRSYNLSNYAAYKSYVAKYPSSPFSEQIRYYISRAEQQNVAAHMPNLFASSDSLRISFSNRNARVIRFELYRLPEKSSKQMAKKMTLVAQQEVRCPDTLSLPFNLTDQHICIPPQPYGCYFLYIRLPEDKEQTDVRKLERWQIEGNTITVSDLRYFQLCAGAYDTPSSTSVVVADSRTGAPLQGVNALFSYYTSRNKKVSKSLKSNQSGELSLAFWDQMREQWQQGNIYDLQMTLTQGKDTYLPTRSLNQSSWSTPSQHLSVNTNAAIFRPGDTLHCSIVGDEMSRLNNRLLVGEVVTVRVSSSSQYKCVLEKELTLDSMASASFSLPFSSDMRLGKYMISVRLKQSEANSNMASSKARISGYRAYANAYVRLEDYRLPTFVLRLDPDNLLLMPKHLRQLKGTAVQMTGLPLTDDSVAVVLSTTCMQANECINKEYKTLCKLDEQGRFIIPLPPTWCDSLYSDSLSLFYGLSVKAELTTREGEQQSTNQYISTNRKKDNIPSEPNLDTDSTATLTWSMPHASQVYVVLSSRDSLISHMWQNMGEGKQHLTYKRPTQKDDYLDASVIYWHPASSCWVTHTKRIPAVTQAQTRLHIVAESMRDYMIPGAQETWSFRLLDQDNLPVQGNMLITIVDQAVQHVYRNNLKPLSPRWSHHFSAIHLQRIYSNYFSQLSSFDCDGISMPDFFGYYHIRKAKQSNESVYLCAESACAPNVRIRGKSADTQADYYCVENEEEVFSSKLSVSDVLSNETINLENASISDDANSTIDLSQLNLRQGDTRYALYRADLQTDSTGRINLSFTSPQDNTTWEMLAMAWALNGSCDTICQSLLAQRTLMMHLTTPRFLRTGDVVELICKVQNAADTAQKANLIMELCIPHTDSVMLHFEQDLTIQPKNEELVQLPITTGNYIGPLMVRAYVRSQQGASDGEKRMVDVLSAIEPVREAETFFMHPDEQELNVFLPTTPVDAKGRKVELMLCDNPVQLVLEDLPCIPDTSAVTVTQTAHNLYALLMRNYIANSYPQYAQHIDTDAMVSKLLRYKTKKGFRWLDEARCEPSLWVTMQVLSLMGELHELHALPANLETTMVELVQYLDEWAVNYENELKKAAKKSVKNTKQTTTSGADYTGNSGEALVDYAYFADYAHLRSMYHDVARSAKADHIYLSALDSLLPDLSKKHLEPWPITALTLERAGRHDDALKVIDGLRKYSTTDARLGMYWNNMPDRWWWYRQADVQALFLQAFQRIDPRNSELTALRQWLLLNYQTTDWGKSSLSSYATSVLLRGMDSTWVASQPRQEAVQHIALPDTTTMYLVRKNPSAPSSVAWGALRVSYDAPASSVQAFGTKTIRLRRSFQVLDDKGKWRTISPKETLKLGDHLRVTLTLKLDREMDNIVISDPRSAALEPESLSGYQWQPAPRGVMGWMGSVCYREVKNSQTNLYVHHLSKGEHTFSYDGYVTMAGTTMAGIADATCMMAEEFTSHTEAARFTTESAKLTTEGK